VENGTEEFLEEIDDALLPSVIRLSPYIPTPSGIIYLQHVHIPHNSLLGIPQRCNLSFQNRFLSMHWDLAERNGFLASCKMVLCYCG